MDLLDLATFLHLYVVNNLPLAFFVFTAIVAFSCLQLLLMMMLIVMLLLDVLVYEQIDVFVSKQTHRHLINCISKLALNNVFISALLEHCTCTAERQMNTYDTWRYDNTHGKQSVS